MTAHRIHGFTLLELSIVLVIIGLIVGGVLVGRDLISAAEVRGTVAQIEGYNTAVRTFRLKYNAMPGDMNATTATQFGFAARGTNPGEGDGNGIIEGNYSDSTTAYGQQMQATGEQGIFWVDLSTAKLIAGTFSTATATGGPASDVTTGAGIALYFPEAKLGRGNYVAVFSINGDNYYSIGGKYGSLPYILAGGAGWNFPGPSMTVSQAYQIDNKIDDGLPESGRVFSGLDQGTGFHFDNSGTDFGTISPSASTCHNGSVGAYRYTLSVNNGAGVNCAIGIRFQ